MASAFSGQRILDMSRTLVSGFDRNDAAPTYSKSARTRYLCDAKTGIPTRANQAPRGRRALGSLPPIGVALLPAPKRAVSLSLIPALEGRPGLVDLCGLASDPAKFLG